jgi:hypothetical protein
MASADVRSLIRAFAGFRLPCGDANSGREHKVVL